jgi:hypothetical protein
VRTDCTATIGAGARDMSLAEALTDPLIRAVMAADGVDPARLAAELGETARRLVRSSSVMA